MEFSKSFDHHGKTKKKWLKTFLKNDKPERPRRSGRKMTDDYVIDCTCEDAHVKVANVKSVKRCSPAAGPSQVPTRTPCVYRVIASGEGTSNNRLWSPSLRSDRAILVCGAPSPMARRGNNNHLCAVYVK